MSQHRIIIATRVIGKEICARRVRMLLLLHRHSFLMEIRRRATIVLLFCCLQGIHGQELVCIFQLCRGNCSRPRGKAQERKGDIWGNPTTHKLRRRKSGKRRRKFLKHLLHRGTDTSYQRNTLQHLTSFPAPLNGHLFSFYPRQHTALPPRNL